MEPIISATSEEVNRNDFFSHYKKDDKGDVIYYKKVEGGKTVTEWNVGGIMVIEAISFIFYEL